MKYLLFACWLVSGLAAAHDLQFEKNAGQAPADVDFLVRPQGGQLLLRASGMEFRNAGSASVRWDWLGAADAGEWRGITATGNSVSYFLGNDRRGWVERAPAYSRIQRDGLYPGVHWTAYVDNGQLEYDLVLDPGADSSHILLRVSGAAAALRRDGSLETRSEGVTVTQHPPRLYQLVHGERKRVEGRFVARGEGVFGLEIEAYRRDLPLVVDPVIDAVFSFSGPGDDRVVAECGEYSVGVTRSAAWNRQGGGANTDLFIRRETGTGTDTIYWGGDGDDEAASCADGMIGGWTTSDNLPTLDPGYRRAQTQFGGGQSDGFLLLMQYNGPSYATYVGGTGRDRVNVVRGIWVQGVVNGYVFAGETDSASWGDLDVDRRGRGAVDAFIGRVRTGRIALLIFGGEKDDRATGLTVLDDTTFAAAGSTESDDFPLADAVQQQRNGPSDAWLARVVWPFGTPARIAQSTLWGGSGSERLAGLWNVPGVGLYLAGATTSSDLPVTGASRYGGGSDGFVTRLTPDWKRVAASAFLGGSGDDEVLCATLRDHDLVIGGVTASADFPIRDGALQDRAGGAKDGFVAHLDTSGRIVWSTFWGGEDDDAVLSMSARTTGVLRMVGWTKSRRWLQALRAAERLAPRHATEAPAGQDGYLADIEYSYASAPDQTIGKDLQAALPLTVFSAPGADGILTVRSADPAKLLVSLSPETVGSEQVTVFDADVRVLGSIKAVYLQALEAGAETEIILSGRYYPERRVKVRLLSSALFVSETEAMVQILAGNNGTYSCAVFAAAIDDQTGQAMPAQPVRAGLDPGFLLTSSDESNFKPDYSSSNGYSRSITIQVFNFQPIREGVYTLMPSSAAFAAAPGQQVTVRVDTRNWPDKHIYVARGARARVTPDSGMGVPLHLVSEDPSKLMLSVQPTGTEGAEADYPASSPSYNSFFVSALADHGEVAVRIEGPDGRQARVIVAMAPLEVSILPSATRIPVTQLTRVSLRARPIGQPPAGFTIPEQWLRPAGLTASISDLSVLRDRGLTLDQWDWNMALEGLQPGTATVSFNWPAHSPTQPQLEVQVVPGSVWFDGAEVILPEGGMRDWTPSVFLGDYAAQHVSLTLAHASIATFDMERTELTTYLSRGVRMFGVGKSGEETVLTVSAPGMPEMKIPVRIVPKLLLPAQNEVRIDGSGNIAFQVAAMHPGTGALISGYLRADRSGAIPVRVEADPAGICEFDSEVNTVLKVTCAGSGETIIRVQPLSGFGPTPEFGRIRIIANDRSSRVWFTGYGTPMPRRALLGNRLQTKFEIPNGITGPITLTSGDPAKVRLSATAAGPLTDRLTVEYAQAVYLHGFASEGEAIVLAEPANLGQAEITVHFHPPTMALTTGITGQSDVREVRKPLSEPLLYLQARPGLLDTASGAVYTNEAIRMGADIEPFLVTLRSSDRDVAEPQPPTPLFSAGSSSESATFRLRRAGVADLSVTPPEGFVEAPGAAMRVRVYEPGLQFSSRVVLDKDLMQMVSVSPSEGNSGGGVKSEVTVTTLDPDKVLVSASGAISGQTSVTVPLSAAVFLQALTGEGPARVRLQAAGYQDSVVNVEFLPAALGLDSPFLEFVPGAPGSVTLRYAPMERDRLISGWTGGFRPGAAPRLRYRFSDPAVARASGDGEVAFAPQTDRLQLPFQALRPGNTEIIIDAPSDLRTTVARVPIRVKLWTFSTQYPVTVGRFLTAPLDVTAPRAGAVTARASLTAGATLLMSLDQKKSGEASLAVPLAQDTPTKLYLQPVGAGDRSNVTLSAPDFEDFRVQVYVANPQFAFRPASGTNLDLNLTAGTATVPIVLATADYYTGGQALGPSRGAVRVEVKSSNLAVVKPAVDWLEFQPGDSSRTLTLQLAGRGNAVLTLQAPEGFNLPTGKQEILVTVR